MLSHFPDGNTNDGLDRQLIMRTSKRGGLKNYRNESKSSSSGEMGQLIFRVLLFCLALKTALIDAICIPHCRHFDAHTKKLGMTVIDEFEFNGRPYHGLAFDMARSVLGGAVG